MLERKRKDYRPLWYVNSYIFNNVYVLHLGIVCVRSSNCTISQVAVLHDSHTCTSSGRRKTTTPSSGWVAFHALPLLMKKPHMGAKELQDTLQGVHNVTIGYDTVWKGKEKALKELFGSWEESFKLLFSWREAVLANEPDNIVEIDVVLEDGKYYFNRFLCTRAVHIRF
jgi:hypothetical protein